MKIDSFEHELGSLFEKTRKKERLSLREILGTLSGKGLFLVLIIITLPFCQPIQIPGLSTPFGLLIFILGIRAAFGKGLWLPEFLLKKTISSKKIERLYRAWIRVFKKIHFLIHPRLIWLVQNRFVKILNTFVIAILGVLLALPLPVPFSNIVSGWAIVLISLGSLENDGLFVLLGHLLFIITLFFFAAIIFSIQVALN